MSSGRASSISQHPGQAARSRRPRMETLEPRWMMAGPPQKFVQPLGGAPNVDWTITYYVDVDPSPDQSRDYTGGDYAFEGHAGLDISLANFAKMDAGVPVLAVAD